MPKGQMQPGKSLHRETAISRGLDYPVFKVNEIILSDLFKQNPFYFSMASAGSADTVGPLLFLVASETI
jgi:hypothetical protein